MGAHTSFITSVGKWSKVKDVKQRVSEWNIL